MTARPQPSSIRLVVLVAALLAGACDAGTPDARPLALRPADDLADDPGLQAVVDLQVARDGEMLTVMLTDERGEVRARAALALASVQHPGAADALGELLGSDPEPDVRRDAAYAIGQLAQAGSVAGLQSALETEGEAEVRDRIIEALGKIGTAEASDALRTAELSGRDAARRAWALSVNGAVKGVESQDAQDFLLSQLDASDADVRAGAAYFFGRTDETGLWSARASRVREALDGYARNERAAIYLVQALAKLGDASDRDRLLDWAGKATDWRIRSGAYGGLARHVSGSEVAEQLVAGLDDPVAHVALQAASGLATAAQPPSVIGPIATWVGAHPDRTVTAQPLLTLLGRQNELEPVLAWAAALGPDDTRGWLAVIPALGLVNDQSAFQDLAEAARSSHAAISSAATGALANRFQQDKRVPELVPSYYALFVELLTSGDPQVENAAAEALVDPLFRGMGVADAYVAAYREKLAADEPERAAEMLRYVFGVQAPETEALLREALEHPSPALKRIGSTGIQQLTGEIVLIDIPAEVEEPDEGPTLPYDPTVMDWEYFRGLGDAPRLGFETDRGAFTVRMVPSEAPHTVQTMARLAEEGRFDGTPFHRVIPNFVAQGGDVDGGTGRGGPGFMITSEFNGLPYQRGSIGMASAGKDTEGSQFFLAHTRLPHLDGNYTVFGWVESGMDVVDAIVRGDRIVTVRLDR